MLICVGKEMMWNGEKWELKWLLGGETKWREHLPKKSITNLEIEDRQPGKGKTGKPMD